MEKKGLISICILSFNHKNFVKYCIDRVREQKYENTEIIVLDDGSTDGTPEVITNELKNFSPNKYKFISQKNTGNVPANMNKLLQNSNGEFVYITSMDDMLCDKSSLQKMADVISKNENICFCSSDRTRVIDDENSYNGEEIKSIFYAKKSDEITVEQLFKSEIEDSGSFFVQGSLYRKSIIEKVGGWDEDILGDDIVIRTKIYQHMMLNPSMKFEIINDYIFDYRHHEKNLHKNVERQVETVHQVIKRYSPNSNCKQLYPWSMHAIREYLQKVDFFINHDSNRIHRLKMIGEVINHYELLQSDISKSKFTVCALCRDRNSKSNLEDSIANFFPDNTEYLFVDNNSHKFDSYDAFTFFISKASGDFILVIHDDVSFDGIHFSNLLNELNRVIKNDPRAVLFGVAGKDDRFFCGQGHFYSSRGEEKWGFDKKRPISSFDECFLVIKNGIGIELDSGLKGFHFYGTELCLQARQLGYSCHLIDFPISHSSDGSLDKSFFEAKKIYEQHVLKRYGSLFISTTCTVLYTGKSHFMKALRDALSLKMLSNKFTKHKDHETALDWIRFNGKSEYGIIFWFIAKIIASVIFIIESNNLRNTHRCTDFKNKIKYFCQNLFWKYGYQVIRPIIRVYTDILWWKKNWKTRL